MSCSCPEDSEKACCRYKRGFAGATGLRGPTGPMPQAIPGARGNTGRPGSRGAPGVGFAGRPGNNGNANQQEIIDSIRGEIDWSWLNQQMQDDWSGIDRIPLLFDYVQETNDEIAAIKGAQPWNPQIAYPQGVYVQVDGVMYRAKLDVPAGIPITNRVFWEPVGDYWDGGPNMEVIRVKIDDLDKDIENQTIRANQLEVRTYTVEQNTATNTQGIQTLVTTTGAQTSSINRLEVTSGQNTAAIDDAFDLIATNDGAQTRRVNTLSAEVTRENGVLRGEIKDVSDVVVKTNGDLSVMRNLKVSATAGGREYIAGIGLGVYSLDGQIRSEIIFDASKIVMLDSASGSLTYPFLVEGGIVYINMARIKNLVVDTIDIKNGAVTAAAASNYHYDNGVYGDNLNQSFNISATTYPHTYLMAQARIQLPANASALLLNFSVDIANGRIINPNEGTEPIYENTGNAFVVIKTNATTNSQTVVSAMMVIPLTQPMRLESRPIASFSWVDPSPIQGDWYYTVAIRGVNSTQYRNNTSWGRPRILLQGFKR